MPQLTIPHDADAEQIVLANCFLSSSREPLGDLTPEHFYSTQNAKIAQAIIALDEAKQPINFLDVCQYLDANQNGVSASYVSGITDGIPQYKDCEPFCRRIRGKLQERAVLWEANALARAAESGESSVQIVERAEHLAASGKPPKTKTKQVYPELPEEAWYGLAELYRKALSPAVEASDNYLFASFLIIAGSLLGRTVFTKKGRLLYPNLYMVLVGDSAEARKGTAIGCALDFYWERETGVYLTSTIDSKQAFIVDLQEGQKQMREKGHPGELRALLWLDEFRSFLETAEQKGTKAVVNVLCTGYDCPPELANKVINKDSRATVEKPTISLLSGTSQDFLQGLTVKDIKGGLGNRICFVPGDPKQRNWDIAEPDYSVLMPVFDHLLDTARFWRERGTTRFYLSAEANAYCKKFYEKEFNPAQVDELLRVLSNRDPATLLKIALIFAALDRSLSKLLDGSEAGTGKIELHHVKAARAFVQFLYESRFPVFAGHGVAPTVQAQQRIMAIVQDRKQISASNVLRLMSRYGDAPLVWRLSDALERSGMIEIRPVGKMKYLIWKGE